MIAYGHLKQWKADIGFDVGRQFDNHYEVAVVGIVVHDFGQELLLSSQMIGTLCFAQPCVDFGFGKDVIERLGLVADDNDSVQRATSVVEVRLQLHRRHLQRTSVVGESSSRRCIGWQVAGVVHLQTEQVVHRVLVLDAIESPNHSPSVGVTASFDCLVDRLRKPGGQRLLRLIVERWLIFGRHLTASSTFNTSCQVSTAARSFVRSSES